MADQPAKALIVYGDRFMRHLAPRHSNLHALAAAGSCGFLALRSQAPSSAGNFQEDRRVVGELSQLLDLHDVHQKILGNEANDEQLPSMSERFMKIKAGMLSNCEPGAAFGKQAGFTLLHLQDETSDYTRNPLPEPSAAASRLLSYLGLQDPSHEEKHGDFELLLLHLEASKQYGIDREDEVVDWTDKLVGALHNQPSPAASHLYLVVVLGYGSVNSTEDGVVSLLSTTELEPKLAQLVPRQSYTMKAGHLIEGIREHHPLLVVYHLNGVTRRDEVTCFTFDEFKQHCGNLTIFVDRFLHEVAFKLWRAPKYGA